MQDIGGRRAVQDGAPGSPGRAYLNGLSVLLQSLVDPGDGQGGLAPLHTVTGEGQ